MISYHKFSYSRRKNFIDLPHLVSQNPGILSNGSEVKIFLYFAQFWATYFEIVWTMEAASMSEIKHLLEQITLSYEAAQRALTSPSIMAKHAFIQKRMEEIEIARDRLTTVLGDE